MDGNYFAHIAQELRLQKQLMDLLEAENRELRQLLGSPACRTRDLCCYRGCPFRHERHARTCVSSQIAVPSYGDLPLHLPDNYTQVGEPFCRSARGTERYCRIISQSLLY